MAKRKKAETPSLFGMPAAPEPASVEQPSEQPQPEPATTVNVEPEDDIPAVTPAVVSEQPQAEQPEAAPAVTSEQPQPEQKQKQKRKYKRGAGKVPAQAPAVPEISVAELLKAPIVVTPDATETAGQRLQQVAMLVAVRVQGFGNTKRMDRATDAVAANAVGVNETKNYKGSLQVLDDDCEEWVALLAVKAKILAWIKANTLPWLVEGERILPLSRWDAFKDAMTAFKVEMRTLAQRFADNIEGIRNLARQKHGAQYRESWFANDPLKRFAVDDQAKSWEPPAWMREVDPEGYQRQQEQFKARMEAAACNATEYLAREFLKFVAILENKLTPDPVTGDRQILKESAIENVRAVIDYVRSMNLTSNAQLLVLCDRAEALTKGLDADTIKALPALEGRVREGMAALADAAEKWFMIEDDNRPARQIVRNVAPASDDGPAAA